MLGGQVKGLIIAYNIWLDNICPGPSCTWSIFKTTFYYVFVVKQITHVCKNRNFKQKLSQSDSV